MFSFFQVKILEEDFSSEECMVPAVIIVINYLTLFHKQIFFFIKSLPKDLFCKQRTLHSLRLLFWFCCSPILCGLWRAVHPEESCDCWQYHRICHGGTVVLTRQHRVFCVLLWSWYR